MSDVRDEDDRENKITPRYKDSVKRKITARRNKHRIENEITRGAPLALIMAAIIYILYRLVLVLEIFAVAALLALVLRTSLRWLEKILKLRWLAVLVLIALGVGFWAFIVLVLIPDFMSETRILLTQLPNYVNKLRNYATNLHSTWNFLPDLGQGFEQVKGYLVGILGSVPLALRETFGGGIEAIGTLILAIYMAYDPNSVIRGILRLVPRRHHDRFYRLIESLEVRLQGWIFGTGIAMLFVGVGAGIGLWIIGVPLALSFAVFAGVFEIIPYLGSIAGTVLPALVALTTPNGPMKALYVILLFLFLNQVGAHVIQPLIVGKHVHVSPIMVILAFLSMGNLFGFFGVLVAVPAAATLMTVIDEFTPAERMENAPEPKVESDNP